MAKKVKEFKRCPRCDTKAVIYQDKCNACGLIYSRLANASNKEAKKALKRGQKNRVICDKTLPKDVNKWKLFFMALFLGLFGGHFYYVGKYKTGIVFSASIIMLLSTGLIDFELWYKYSFWIWFLILPASGCLVYWAVTVVQILTNTFRVPIALKEEVVVDKKNENVDTDAVLKIVEQVSEKVEKDKKAEAKQKEKEQKTITKNKETKPVEKTEEKPVEKVKEEKKETQKTSTEKTEIPEKKSKKKAAK